MHYQGHTTHNPNTNITTTTQPTTQYHSTHTLSDSPINSGTVLNYDRDAPPARVYLKPIAPPSALGHAAHASALFIVGTWLTTWYGDGSTPLTLWPFVLVFGGVGQFMAGMWSYNARDTLATVFHTMWGSFWIGLSIYLGLMATNTFPHDSRYDYNEAWGIWMVPLAAITYVLTAAAMFRDFVWTTTLFCTATGALFGILGWFLHSAACVKILGYFWIVASVFSLYRVACYVMSEAVPHRDVLPRFRHPARGHHFDKGYHHGWREPGVVAGN